MGALNPLFLLAGLAVAVPLFLHLFHRHRARRLAFPALRYLQRTEREHARRIRMRQILLLLLRVAALVLLVLAGARFFVRAGGSEHPPTALVVVMDNSASSSRVEGERRTLDRLKEVALAGLASAGPDDRVWIVRAGEPWAPAVPLGPAAARAVVAEIQVSAGAGDLTAALARAQDLLATADLPHREIHLLSDLQSSAFAPGPPPVGADTEIVVWDPWTGRPPATNRALTSVQVGGGLPPLVGQRTQVSVQTDAGPDTLDIPVRLVVDGRIRGAATVRAGSQASIPLPAVSSGWIRGWVEVDPDALRIDDRRNFAFRARPAPELSVAGDPGTFVIEAVAVLRDADRLAPPGEGGAALLVASEGRGLTALPSDESAMVLPPTDPALVPALNRRLAAAGIPWRYRTLRAAGSLTLSGRDLPVALEDVVVRRWYGLEMAGAADAPSRTLARAGTDPWAVEGRTASGGRYLLVASPLDPASGSLPVSTRMVRFLDWVSGAWASAAGGPVEYPAGRPLAAPRRAVSVSKPDGTVLPVDGTRSLRSTDQAGFYTFLDGDSAVVAVRSVNPPPRESQLTLLSRDEWARYLGPTTTPVDDPERWADTVFRVRQGPELWFPLLLAAFLLLLGESLVAAGGRGALRKPQRPPTPYHDPS